MNIKIKISDGLKLEALIDKQIVKADIPTEHGGTGTAPTPFDYFLASIGLCTGHYINVFCKERQLETKDIKISLEMTKQSGGKPKIGIKVGLPSGFPDKYKEALVKSASQCAVKQTIESMPEFELKLV